MLTSLKTMFLFWQVGLVDSFSLIQFCINIGSQYGTIIAASVAGNFSDIGPKVLFEPKQVEIIAKYLFQILAFNSTFAKGPNGNEEDLFFDSHNQLLFYSSKYNTC